MKNLFKDKKFIGWSLGLLPIFYLFIAYISFSRRDIFLNHLENFSSSELYNVLIVFVFIFSAYSLLFINREFLRVSKKYYYYILGAILLLCFVIPPFMSRDVAGYMLSADIFWGRLGNIYLVNVHISQWAHYLSNLWWLDYPAPYGPLFVIALLPAWLGGLKSFVFGIYIYKLLSLGLFILSAYLLRKMTDTKTFWLYVFNPAILINFVLEGHNDLWIAFLLLVFVYKKKKVLGKYLSLLGAIFIKYTAVILWPLMWFRDNKFRFKLFIISNLIVLSLIALFFWIFSVSPLDFWYNLSFLEGNCFYRCSPVAAIFPSSIIRLGLFIASYDIIAWYFLYRNFSPTKFIIWSFLALFLIKIKWLTPWYLPVLIPLILTVKGKSYYYIALVITFYGLFHYLFL